MHPTPGLYPSLLLAAALCAAVLHPAAAEPVRERELFRSAYEAAERGDFTVVDGWPPAERELLEAYVLWPDLRAAYLRATLGQADSSDVEAFLDRHGMLKPARSLRYRWALALAERGESRAFLDLYRRYYKGLGIARLDCLALDAEIDTGAGERLVSRAKALWLVGFSQEDECDPVFDYLKRQRALTRDDFIARFALALDARNFRLARWLGKSIDADHVDRAEAWLDAHEGAEDYLSDHAALGDDEETRARLVHAAHRLTYRDAALAYRLWREVRPRFASDDETAAETARHIALWTARDALPGAWQQLAALPGPAVDVEVLRWRARSSLRDEQWERLLGDILAMPDEERGKNEWRYWRAVALERLGHRDAAAVELADLARDRSYYGFLAADALGLDYAFGHAPIAPDARILARLTEEPQLVRARELYLVGLEGQGRSEWAAATAELPAEGKAQAAVLAGRWGWHSQAIATAAKIRAYDDLELRYPLPYRRTFESYAKSANIEPTWAYGIARSESLFMADVRSGAGAIGLMQIMPATGRRVASALSLPWQGVATLTDPDASIRLGTAYLASMAERYGGNRVLATAAYNAGPARVDRWLPAGSRIDARIWIENIPFDETRAYVKRVLAAESIFHWRLDGSTQRLSERLAAIGRDPAENRVAGVVAYPPGRIDSR